MTLLDALIQWSGWIAGGLGAVVLAVLSWVGGASRTRRQMSGDSFVVANNEAAIDMLKTLTEREAAANDRANRLSEKERETFEKSVRLEAKLGEAHRDIARLRDRLEDAGVSQSDWVRFMETNLGDLPR